MVNSINNTIAPAVVSQQQGPAVRADIPLPRPAAPFATPPAPAPAPAATTAPELPALGPSREERVAAALESIRNSFAVSDSRFTIFRDITGDFITRITSLRDGSVTTVPEKTLFELAVARDARFAEISASLDTSA